MKRYHYDDHAQLRIHLADFLTAYNFARKLKALTPYEYICKIWTSEPDLFHPKPDPPDAGTEHLLLAWPNVASRLHLWLDLIYYGLASHRKAPKLVLFCRYP